MSVVRGYLRHRRAVLALVAVVGVVFPGIQALYGLPLAPVAYALLILLFLLAVGAAVDFARYAAKARALRAVLHNVSEAAHALPEPTGPIEALYQQWVHALYALLDAQGERLTRLHGEQVDYYTLWVHQIKTPIAAMRLALQARANPQTLHAELFKVERYVEMALQFVKLADLSGDLILQPYDLAPIVSGCVKKYAPLFIGKKLSVDIQGVEGMRVETDSRWLAFIIEQLLSNAIKYTQKGGVRVVGAGGTLTIADTGVGIAAQDIARIFEKGYTGYNGRMDERASGLGLYMARQVAGHLGIRIHPESTPGQGTRMTLTFPARRPDIE